jgi:formamidopyrimidine-DNA glycosylase
MRYRDDKQMGKVYVYAPADRDKVPGLEKIGVDVLGPEFTPERLRVLARGRREQVKVFLMDKATIDAFGNAYADEALWAARIHPKARVNELSADALLRLHGAMIAVLSEARDEVAARKPPLDAKVRDFLVVRNKKGAPCPRCGAPVRVLGVLGHDAFFCAVCQPDEKGRGLVDWRRA